MSTRGPRSTRRGADATAFINHSCQPNVFARTIDGHMLFFALRQIGRGEELCLDYGASYHDGRKRCRCGTRRCRGVHLGNSGTRPANGDLMRVLVTGGAGFVGSHVVDALLRAGHQPLALDDLSTGSTSNLPAGVPLFMADIADGDAVERAIDGQRFDAVVHCAAKTKVVESVERPDLYRRVLVTGTKNVIRAANTAGAQAFVNISTGGAMYGETATRATEGTPPVPASPYGTFKLMAEDFVAMTPRMRAVTLRLANVYGPRQRGDLEGGVVSIFLDRWLRNSGLTVFGDGTAERDYVFVSDCANAVINALRLPVRGIFNIGTGIATSVNRLIEELSAILGPAPSLTYARARPGEVQRSVLDAGKAARAGLLPVTTALRAGLLTTIAAMPAGDVTPISSGSRGVTAPELIEIAKRG
jgi:UDP-glucose 4-epimerase